MRTRRPATLCLNLLAMTTNLNAFIICGMAFLHLSAAAIYTDQWAVHIEDGPEVADEIARKHDFVNLGRIVADYYHFQHRKVAKRSLESNDVHHTKLIMEPAVRWAKQQTLRRRTKRDFKRIDLTNASQLNDPLWPKMWYLNRGHGLDMNVEAAWAQDVTGKGVVVTILDDGLEKDHPDLKLNYDPFASYDANNHDDDPQPRYDFINSNRHGTRCAGEVAAHANNSICTVGIAYDAKVGGVRMLDGDVTDAVEARSLSLNPQHIHIYSASWGPDDDGKTVDGPGELATRAFLEGILHGRNGLGSIFVWASGNGGQDHDNCNCDGYTNSIWTLSISSATENGLVPWYSEACSSTLASTYSSGSAGERQVVTTDLHHHCTDAHTGTSASAPLAAGICALALQVNPKLTWRDMQHIVVRTAKPANLRTADWQTNGVGRNVSHSFGYGLMDAAAMVDLARNWTTVPPQKVCEAKAPYANKLIPAKSKVVLNLYVDCPEVRYLEHVQAKISLSAPKRGDIQIYLTSPAGTRSNLLAARPNDVSSSGFHSWPFMTVHSWGERPDGIWSLEIDNEGRYEEAEVKDAKLVVYGTKENPISDWKKSNEEDGSGQSTNVPTNVTSVSKAAACRTSDPNGRCLDCADKSYLVNGECVAECPNGYFPSTHQMNITVSILVCLHCHYTCKTCGGPNDYQCTECFADANLHGSYCRPQDLLHEMTDLQNYGFALTLIVVVLAIIILLLTTCLLCQRNHPKDYGHTYTVLPQTLTGLNSKKDVANSTRILHSDDANDDTEDET